jgi:hypothetical protein
VNPIIDAVWLTAEHLDRRSRPPRRSAKWPHDRAQGWHADHTGAHEQRRVRYEGAGVRHRCSSGGRGS